MEFPATKATKDAIRAVIGQTVTFVLQGTNTACPTCSGLNYYDEVNQTSLDWSCTVCSGAYWIFTRQEVTATAHVRWARMDEDNKDVGGKVLTGDCYLTIASDALTESQLNGVQWIVADNRTMQIYRKLYKGVPTRDRILLVAREYGAT